MFGHLFKYAVKTLLKTREIVFWTLLFPIVLCSFMYFSFGSLFDTTEKFSAVPVAVVEETEQSDYENMLNAVAGDGEDAVLKITKTDRENAEKLLKDEKVTGIYYLGEGDPTLKVRESGMNETILQTVLTRFIQYRTVMEDVLSSQMTTLNRPVSSGDGDFNELSPVMEKVSGQLSEQEDCFVEKQESEGNQDNVANYFYAILAMTCLFAAFTGCTKIQKLQADSSALGQRRGVSGTHKMTSILAEFAACEVMQYIVSVVVFIYMRYILGIHIGDKPWAVLLLLLLGTSCGVMFGILLGSLPKLGEGMKTGLVTGISLLLCMLSDLMVSGLKDMIEHKAPVINDINPAALISDSFYALNIYDNYDRFIGNVVKLGVITAILAVVSYMIVRRNRYASL